MRKLFSATLAVATLALTTLPSTGFAADGDWSLCENPGWGEQFGYEFILTTDGAMASAEGSTCQSMGSHFEAAQSKSCEMSLANLGQRWGVKATSNGALTSLTCG